MPEIKHSFTGGKMNKDLDERVVPNGEYRNAMNIQVRTTEGDGDTGVGNSGSVQNIPGNLEVPNRVHTDESWVLDASGNKNKTRVVGSVADEKNNKAYFFAAGMDLDQAISYVKEIKGMKLFIDTIYEVDTQNGMQAPTSAPIVVDKWGVVGDFKNTNFWAGPTGDGPTGTFDRFFVDEQVFKHLRVGMTMRVVDIGGDDLMMPGAEIFDLIQGTTGGEVILYSTSAPVNFEQATPGCAVAFIFEAQRVLNFENPVAGRQNIISAINVIEDLLFWTDNQPGVNQGEPKKVNIHRCREGSLTNLDLNVWTDHTQLKLTNPIDDSVLVDYAGQSSDELFNVEDSMSPSINNDLREEHITVIRKSPRTAPTLEMSNSDRGGVIEVVGVEYDFYGIADAAGEEFGQGWQTTISGESLFMGNDAPNWQINDILIFTEEIGAEDNMGVIKATIDAYNSTTGDLQVTILSVTSNYTAQTEVEGSGVWEVALEQDRPLFELKFGRFACRYKYEDGEFSSFSPWSELAFLPGRFDYNYKKGYNLGMVNTLRSLKIKDFIPHQRTRNADVVAVEVLYKNTESPNCYVVRTLTRGIDPEWSLFTPTEENDGELVFGELTITSEMIHKTVEKNQLLRAWDNVPRYALAQEIAANRVMYSNYTQGYEVGHVGLEQALISDNTATMMKPKKSIKSMRNYKFGMVFGDKYGRETTVIANGYITGSSVNNYSMVDGDVYVDVEFAPMKSSFQLKQVWDSEGSSGAPDSWMEYVKYYIKETSNEYYNLIMDRWYEAEDGNVWLSFVSADRNKVDLETYLVLKNGHGNNDPITQEARYKILAIEEEAPDFIKVDDRFMGKILLGEDDYPFIFSGSPPPTAPDTLAPYLLMTESTITISPGSWNNFLQNYSGNSKGDLKVRVVGIMGGTELASREWKTVTYYSTGAGNGLLRWNGTFGETADMLDRFTNQGLTPVDGLQYYLEFKEEVVTNTFPQFDGKFFVKVERDDVLETNVMVYNGISTDYDNTGAYLLGYINNRAKHPSNNGRRSGYDWFSESVGGNRVEAVNSDNPLETWDDGSISTYSEYNVLGQNIAKSDDANDWPNSAGDSPYGWNLEEGSYSISLGCDGRIGNLPDGITGTPYPMIGSYFGGGECCSDNAEWINYDTGGSLSGKLVNFAHPTRQFWEWIQNHVHGNDGNGRTPAEDAVGYKMFIDECRLKHGKLTGPLQDDWNTDYNNGDRRYSYYKPTGLDRGYQTGAGYGQVPANEFGRIFISCHTADGWGGLGAGGDMWGFYANPNTPEAEFKNHMTTEGNMFRFADCPGDAQNPDGYIYRIVGEADILQKGRNMAKLSWQYEESNQKQWAAFEAENGVAGSYIGAALMVNNFHGGADGDSLMWFNSEQLKIGGEPGDMNGGNYSRDCGTCMDDWNYVGAVSPYSGNNDFCLRQGFRVEFRRVDTSANNLAGGGTIGIDPGVWDPRGQICHDGREAMFIYTVGANITGGEVVQPVKDAACFETEPKEDVGLDIYYEASNAIPQVLTSENTPQFAPYHSKVHLKLDDGLTDVGFQIFDDHRVFHIGYDHDSSIIGVESRQGEEYFPHIFPQDIMINRHLVFEHPDGTKTMSRVRNFMKPNNQAGTFNLPGDYPYDDVDDIREWTWEVSSEMTGWYQIDSEVWKYPVKLSWFNCYSFGNGVESDRIRDDYNAPTIDNGVKVSTTFLDYGQEYKGSTIIYSGVYNSISGVNNLNEFNMAEKITKDLNPSYGSIQALKTRDTDVIVFTEDKTLKVTTHKDALYNADGNAQLLASNRVLGTAVPFGGDYGISDNPESLAWDEYRIYYTDKQRGAVLRLSGNGITPISSVGMKTWFRDNLRQTNNLLGGFDVVSGEYNLTLDYKPIVDKEKTTIAFNEGSKGWVSFRSFIPEEGVSISGKYFTSKNGVPFEHHVDIEDEDTNSLTFGQILNRNTFYGDFEGSSINVLFNEMPGSVKTFKTINYEGSQALIRPMTQTSFSGPNNTQVNLPLGDGEYYNLNLKLGWYVREIITDQSDAGVAHFKDKEGKWFSRISGGSRGYNLSFEELNEFAVQGIGFMGTGNNMGMATITTTGTSTTASSGGDTIETTTTTSTSNENNVIDGVDGDNSVGTDQNNDDGIADGNDDDNLIPLPTVTVTLQGDGTNNQTPDSTPNTTD